MTWTLVANLKGPKGDIGSWDGGNVATGADLATFYGSTASPYRLVSYSVPSDATASSLIGAPKGAKAGTLTVVSLGSTAALHAYRNASDGREWQQAVYSNAASNTGWRETQRKGTKRVAEPLTVAGSALYNTATDVGVRLPFRVPATPARWRVHIRNQNDRTSTAFSGALSFTGVSVGKAAVGADGRPTGQFNGGKNPVALAFASSSTGGQWVSEWMDYTLLPGEDYILSYGYTSAAQNNHASVGGGWLTDLGSSAINTDDTALTPTKNAPLDVWMAYEVDEEVPQFAYFGDSLTAGVSADLPVYDSWAKRHAMANGAFAQVYAYSGTGYTEWTSALQSRFNKYTGFSGVAKPERLYVAMGSNDLSSADAATVRDRFNVTIPILKTFTSSSLYLLTILPRLDATAAFETNRQAWNEILRTELPGNAIACYDAAEALEDHSGSVLDPKWRASESDIHLNRAGYARYAAALTAAGGSASGVATAATLAALPTANLRNQGNTYYVESEGKPYFSNGTTWQPVSSGEAGPVGPSGAGVPAGGTALQIIRKDAAGTTTEWATPDKALVGLSSVDNTADADKPVSVPQAEALVGKADLAASVSTGVFGVGDPATPAFYQARITAPDGSARAALRIDQKNTVDAVDAVKIVNLAPSYALKIDQTGATPNDTVNINAPGGGAHTVLGVGGANTTLSTVKITNSGAQVGGAVVFAQGTDPARTSAIFTSENYGVGASFSAHQMLGANAPAFRAIYDEGYAHDARAIWIDANHTSGSIVYVNNPSAQASGQMVNLVQSHASSAAPIIQITNAGTGDHITANNFKVSQGGNVSAAAMLNIASFNNARVQLTTLGTVVDRNVADSGAVLRVNNNHATSTGDIAQFQSAAAVKARVTKTGHFAVRTNAAPADADLVANEAALWFDPTNGAAKIMWKAKQADGTIKTGTLALA